MWQPKHEGKWVLRLGSLRAELWRDDGALLQLQACVELSSINRSIFLADPGVVELNEAKRHLADALAQLLTDVRPTRSTAVDIVVESGWLPVSLVDCGEQLWGDDQILALARHRMTSLYGAAAQRWMIRTSYLKGDAKALVFGLPAPVLETLRHALGEPMPPKVSVQPALAWGWDRLRRAHRHKRLGWWLWAEQDRGVVGLIKPSGVVALNTAAAEPLQEAHVHATLGSERKRLGVTEADVPVTVCVWRSAPPIDSADGSPVRMHWHYLASDDRQLPVSTPPDSHTLARAA